MKFLLTAINAKFIHSNLAVRSLAAYAAGVPGWEVTVKEYTINQLTEELLSGICVEKPDAVGFSCYIWNMETVRKLVKALLLVLPEIKIFLGGPEVSFHPETVLLELPEVTAILVGEGEATFRDLLTAFGSHKLPERSAVRHIEGLPTASFCENLRAVPGLYLPDTGFTGSRPPLPMDEVPFFYDGEVLENRIIYYESTRGCPFRCSYCLSSVEKTLRRRSFPEVKKHLDLFLSEKVRQVKFIDRTFNADLSHALRIWQYLLLHDNGVTNFHFEIAADLLTDEEITLLNRMRPGAVQLEIGVQTTNERTLQAICRPADTEKIRSAVGKLRAPGKIHLHLDLIAGLPYEDFPSFVHSFNEVYAMRPHELQLGFLKVLKGTPMEDHAVEYDLRYLPYPPYEVLSTKWISYEELCLLKDVEAMLEIHYNSQQFTCTIPLLEEKFGTPFALYLALASWYKEHRYFLIVPGRARRYEILLEFAASLCGEEFREAVREALTLDYYLREDPKKRPAFVTKVPDPSRIDHSRRDPVSGNFRLNESWV